MRSFRSEYKREADLRPIPNDLFDRTRKAMRKTPRRGKTRWGILIPVCALLALGSVTVVGYGIGQFAPFSGPIYQKTLDSSVPAPVNAAVGKTVQKSAQGSGLSVTVNRTACDNRRIYIDFTVKSTDSAPLQVSTAYRRSQLPRSGFAEATLAVGSKSVECHAFRTDDASVEDTAQFEAIAQGDFSGQNGKPVTLSLKDFTDEVDSCEDAGFLCQNLGELYRKMKPERPENFLKTGLFDVYADKSLTAPSWTIPAGKQRVRFSDQYPGSYVDNIGFHKTGEYGCQQDLLYLSITPGSDSEASALKQLCFQNTETGNPVDFFDEIITGNGVEHVGFDSEKAYKKAVKEDTARKLAVNNGRIVLALDPGMDDNRLAGDCTADDLDHYRIARNFKSETLVRFPGEWDIPFTLSFADTSRTFHPAKSYTTPDGLPITFQSITVSDLSISFSGTCAEGGRKALSPNTEIKLFLKDGSVVTEDKNKIGGSGGPGGDFEFSGSFGTLVDAEQIESIELFGVRVPLES
ncbi:hypothetical protein CAFE_18210 [Caprobacter fermentans]|uniref:DUF4179 domain-containing protein n=1 Tax=Caproicibacter fermentans TaxID=2576756 RepID=A0A6N8HZM4_9FIRM|nr:DUF4179 domain-containing protein [Caproicibacter fermentans]MVB11118.1 hypothetical protein [Caproicibacter fermentans]